MNKWIAITAAVILTAGTVANGVLYIQANNELKDARSEITSLEESYDDIEDDITFLDSGFSALENGFSTMQDDFSSLESDVSSVENSVSDMVDDVSGLEDDVSDLNGNYSALESSLSDVEGNIATVEDNYSSLESEVNTLKDDVASLEADTADFVALAAAIDVSIVRIDVSGTGWAGAGSGVIITNDGWVLTASHIVEDAPNVQITLTDGSTYDILDIYLHDTADIALVKIDSSRTDFDAAVLGTSSDVEIGEQVLAVGYQLALDNPPTYTAGIVSAVRVAYDYDGNEYIQIDAAVNGGSSGGPVVNMDGEIIGIVTWGYEWDIDGEGYVYEVYEGINFAVPIDDIFPLPEEVII